MEKSNEPIYKTQTKNEAKRLRAITKWGAIKKSPILLLQYWKKLPFLKSNKNYFAF